MASRLSFCTLLSSVLFGCAPAATDGPSTANENQPSAIETSAAPSARVAFYTVDHYDTARNPADDLVATIARAKAENKNILIQVGGDWCGWCHLMSNYIETNEKVRASVEANYLLMKVTVDGEQTNEAFLSQFPPAPGYPHLFVLDSDGKFLHSQGTAELEQGHGYNDAAYLAFLDKWKPAAR